MVPMVVFRLFRLALLVMVVFGPSACADYSILEGKSCDEQDRCAQGYVCDLASHICVSELVSLPVVTYSFEEIPPSALVRDRSNQEPNVALRPDDSRDPLGVRYESGRVFFSGGRLEASEQASQQLSEALVGAGSFSLEIWCGSDERIQSGPARILTLSSGVNRRSLTFSQEGEDLLVWLRSTATDENGQSLELRYPIFRENKLRHLMLVYDGASGQESLYVDGSPVAAASHVDGQGVSAELGWDVEREFFGMGDEFGVSRPWHGFVEQLRIWECALNSDQVSAAFSQALIE
ncbi:MAG: LamG domain-containing protein [Deltaproteobacteria bacterium]|nr:LamG domain-containing protein [Deltaproteobacteria bacterium]